MLPSYLTEQSRLYRLDKAKEQTRITKATIGAVEWIQSNFYIPETNAPIQLVPYQAHVIMEALSKDDNGLFAYSTVLYSDLKKSAKSSIAGAVALYLAWHNPRESVRIVGNDLKQADSRTFFYIKRAIELHPQFSRECRIKQYEITLPNKTIISAVPVDPRGEAGGGDLIICFTELWAMKNEAAKAMWTETTLSPLKFGKSLRWCESYAGFIGESPILEQLYDVGVKEGKRIDNDLELYRNDRLLAFWNTQPRCPWQTSAYYAEESKVLRPEEFKRIHRNEWGQASTPFVPLEWWTSCKVPVIDFPPRLPMVLSVDAGVSSDCFAIVGLSRWQGRVYVRYVKVWRPENGVHIDFQEPQDEIRRLVNQYNIECCVYDPHELEKFAQELTKEGKVYMRPFGQASPRLEADKSLYDAIRERTIAHFGDADLTEHVSNANAEIDKEGRKLRIVKRTERLKIDACVATSMGHDCILELEL